MPTEKQIAARHKKDVAEYSRGVVAHVTTSALRIIHESQLANSKLWPKHGVVSHSTSTFDKDDIIDVQVRIIYKADAVATEEMIINLVGSNWKRLCKQVEQIELILDQSTIDNISFSYVSSNDIGLGLKAIWITMKFYFIIKR